MPYRSAIAILAFCLSSAALSAQVYRWQDDSGQIHYGQQPPDGVEAEPVDPAVSPAYSGGDGQPSKKKQSASNESDSAGEVDKEFIRKQCKKARKAIKNLKDGGPDARYANENDEIVTYSKEEYQQRLQKNQQFKKKYCDNQGGDKQADAEGSS